MEIENILILSSLVALLLFLSTENRFSSVAQTNPAKISNRANTGENLMIFTSAKEVMFSPMSTCFAGLKERLDKNNRTDTYETWMGHDPDKGILLITFFNIVRLAFFGNFFIYKTTRNIYSVCNLVQIQIIGLGLGFSGSIEFKCCLTLAEVCALLSAILDLCGFVSLTNTLLSSDPLSI